MHVWYTQYYNINAHMIHTVLQYKCTYDTHSITISMHILYTQYYNINAHMIHTVLQYKCTYYTHNITI